tara:strand:+ start:901 stop:1800 length:900 start_codon:yes stop_codon:yes gene_type:complete
MLHIFNIFSLLIIICNSTQILKIHKIEYKSLKYICDLNKSFITNKNETIRILYQNFLGIDDINIKTQVLILEQKLITNFDNIYNNQCKLLKLNKIIKDQNKIIKIQKNNINYSELSIKNITYNKYKNTNNCNFWNLLRDYFKNKGFYANFCGKGGNSKRCTFNKNNAKIIKNGDIICDDSGLDACCSIHDSGIYNINLFNIGTISLCKVDYDFKKCRKKIKPNDFFDGFTHEKNGLNAANCVFKYIPCLSWSRGNTLKMCEYWFGTVPCVMNIYSYRIHFPHGQYKKKDLKCKNDLCYK